MRALLEPRKEVCNLRHPESLPRPVVMDADEGKRGGVSRGLDCHLEGAAGLRPGSELVADGFLNRKAGEDGQPILPSLKVHELAEAVMHSQQGSKGCSLVNFSRASASVVNLLKGHEVWLELAQDGCDSLQVYPAIHAATMLYVVSNKSQGGRFRSLERSPAHENCTGNKREDSEEAD